ncbi:MAG: NHLP leader peptide family RiPP precursor [Methanosarcina sp.]
MRRIKKEIKIADALSREEFQQHVLSKAESNPEFKQALLDNPKQAIEQSGLKLNGDVKIKVVEESPDLIYLVLPQKLTRFNGGCIGCDGVGGCGFCECKSSIGNRLDIR